MLLSRTAFRAALLHLSFNPALIRAAAPTAFTLTTPAYFGQTPSSRLHTVLFPQCAPLNKFTESQTQIRTMASESNSTPESAAQSKGPNESQPQEAQQPQERLALPPSDSSGQKLDLSEGGSSVTLDHLGPMVVNVDGTLSRISNWDQMAEIERKNTLRVISKRNKQRLDALKAARGEE
ncbi:uncharacterized protein N7477_008092 [Penicillium maclennaniae]|uniref:uncharacterized protein n=1 Tax=Penicillium maclennaniae TaxID=1343394 RepID=UPI002541F70E|nr:uncharacterized protein N7477_008092 [Penicillium maclennaniae]KAJ5665644.1 hypothetical protein N7477_008092 [Penicillium maclennaniae]